MDDIGDIFPNESIWSGNKSKASKFFGGRSESDNSPKNNCLVYVIPIS